MVGGLPAPGKIGKLPCVAIREYRPDDFNELWRLDQECFAPEIAYSRFELMHNIRRKNSFTLIHDGQEGIRGFVVAECRGGMRERRSLMKPAGHIITIDVAKGFRRERVGTRLMEAAESRLLSAGCDAVYLEAAIDNEAAIKFYKRRGYFVLSVIPRYYHDQLDALLMGKRLGTPAEAKKSPVDSG